MRDLAEREVRSLALDLPGHGASSIARISDVGDYSRVLVEFLKAKGLQATYLAGHSMGGAVVLRSVLSNAGLARGVVLIGTGARLKVKKSILEGAKTDFERTVSEIIGYAFSPKTLTSLLEESRRSLLSCDADVLYHDFGACDRFDVFAEVKSVSVPALVICGEDDLLTPPKYSQFLHDNISDAKFSIIPQAGHMVMLEQPSAVGALISQFVHAS